MQCEEKEANGGGEAEMSEDSVVLQNRVTSCCPFSLEYPPSRKGSPFAVPIDRHFEAFPEFDCRTVTYHRACLLDRCE